ncbi:hypothetical protein CHL78_010045 [Romboutsia weinsteinii]|uniref:Uncharacterized protein n=1 Tax=Romboutsia weinsteinii TaxID=2020949 RepID=A0A371J3R5_9FIRM|nr:hypothetical protein [Romboutsia weinsteinii]RDY27318.1 hypothetical protein CHL78_010045 [Romboutsia weinsteinii]
MRSERLQNLSQLSKNTIKPSEYQGFFSILETVGYVINHKDNQLDNVTKNLILSMGIKIDGDKLGNNSNLFNDQFISEKRNSVFDNKLVTERKEDK